MSRLNGLFLQTSCVVVISSYAATVNAFDRYVPAGYPTIQAAVDAAADGDEVILVAGMFSGPGNRDIDLKGKALVIRGANVDDPTIVAATKINCQGTPSEPHRAVTLNCENTGATCGLAGLTIVGAYADDGAIICGPSSAPTIRRCVITGGTGSAIYCDWWSRPTIVSCRIEANAGGTHEGVAGQYGGAVQLVHDCTAAIRSCIIRGNTAQLGGGIYSYSSWLDITDTEITGNYASDQGGGVYWEDGSVKLTNCTLSGNQAQSGGGLCGASRVYADDSQVRNCIIWGNTAGSSPQIALSAADSWLDVDSLVVAYSLVEGGKTAISVPAAWTLDWQAGNLSPSANPLFVSPAVHAAGSPAVTQQTTDYRLLGTSPCIDAGDPTLNYTGRTDPANQPRILGPRADVGAYETTASAGPKPAKLPGDINADGKVDILDLHRLVSSWGKHKGQSGFDAASDLDGSGYVNIMDLMILVRNFNKSIT